MFEKNKSENLIIYTISLSKLHNIDSQVVRLDLKRILDGEELLNFGLDDHGAGDHFSRICLQAKNLYLYIVDYVTHDVV